MVKRVNSREDLEDLRKSVLAKRDPKRPLISICSGTGCQACGSEAVISSFISEMQKENLTGKIDIKRTGCPGLCERGTIVVIYPQGILYQKVQPEDVKEIISETILKGRPVDRLLYCDPATGQKFLHENEIPFYKKQMRILLENNSIIDATNIEDYIALGGYSALAKALFDMTPEEIIDVIIRSGLRGRGGAGFPTGRKWESCRKAVGYPKYVICNADEGDPGAFMNRSLLESNPHLVIEGMIIGAYAIGSSEGYVYIRHEYPLAAANLAIAISQATEYGFLGDHILGSNFNFSIKIRRGGGAFVCGESTALIASLEGRIGEPRAKYVHMVEHGLWDKPTNLNNVETWANVPLIISKGADWFSGIGTEKSKGTKIFSLVGKIRNTGLVEVPLGITLRDIIFDIGGGIPDGKRFKAVQTGGPSGGCIPESLLDLPVDYERLTEAGSMMGSGGMIVMDENTCMVDVARYFLNFLSEESCGKCVPCREGIERMLEIVTRITSGKGKPDDLELLEELALVVKDFSLCGLGQTAPNPVLSTLRYFRDEYEAHLRGKCPAGVCKELIRYSILTENCTGCGLCRKNCPSGAIIGQAKSPHSIDQEKCIKCGICRESCKFDAVLVS